MVRVCKSLVPPEQGYPHRDHRSRKASIRNYRFSKRIKKKKEENIEAELYDQQMQAEREQWEGEEFTI